MIKRVVLSIVLAALMVACTSEMPKLNSVSAEEFALLLEQKEDIQIVDVRTAGEFVKGHIPGAVNINIRDTAFQTKVKEKLLKDLPIAVYCRSGNRSKLAGSIMMDMGYEVYELNPGVVGWKGKVEY